jgi:hypothetical protein
MNRVLQRDISKRLGETIRGSIRSWSSSSSSPQQSQPVSARLMMVSCGWLRTESSLFAFVEDRNGNNARRSIAASNIFNAFLLSQQIGIQSYPLWYA